MKKWLYLFILVPTFIFASEKNKVGFGIGQTIGYSFLSPSLFTMRFKIKPSFYIAPEINIIMDNSSSKEDSVKSSKNLYGFEMNGYLRFSRIAEANMIAILGFGIEYDKTKEEYYIDYYPSEKYTIESDKQTYAFNMGLGYEKFLKPFLSLNINTISAFSLFKEKTTTEHGSSSQTTKSKGQNLDLKNLNYTVFLIWYI
jgi:hypothetical protein